jgi:hypothetical protein
MTISAQRNSLATKQIVLRKGERYEAADTTAPRPRAESLARQHHPRGLLFLLEDLANEGTPIHNVIRKRPALRGRHDISTNSRIPLRCGLAVDVKS